MLLLVNTRDSHKLGIYMTLMRREEAIYSQITAPAVLPNFYNWAISIHPAGEGFCAYRADAAGGDDWWRG